MSVTKAQRSIKIIYSGEVGGTQEIAAADNTDSPQMIQVVELPAGTLDGFEVFVPGQTEVLIPTGATAVTILKPSDNTGAIKFGSNAYATAFGLHPTDPDTISLASGEDSFLLWSVSAVTLRLFWS